MLPLTQGRHSRQRTTAEHNWRSGTSGGVLQTNTRCSWATSPVLTLRLTPATIIKRTLTDSTSCCSVCWSAFTHSGKSRSRQQIHTSSLQPSNRSCSAKQIKSWPSGGTRSTGEANKRCHNTTEHRTAAARQHKAVCQEGVGESSPVYSQRQRKLSATAGTDSSAPQQPLRGSVSW